MSLGTPLATIKLVSTELAEELEGQPQLAEDAQLISSQADRCRDILRSMGRAGKDDLHMRSAPLGAVVREAAEPHANRGVEIEMEFTAGPGAPEGSRSSGASPRSSMACATSCRTRSISPRTASGSTAHGATAKSDWSSPTTARAFRPTCWGGWAIRSLRRRSRAPDLSRPGYEGMGLGLFIAKTLLERSGAKVAFVNATDPFLAPEDMDERAGATG
jgi:two-component system sensor histidine kinase RegB